MNDRLKNKLQNWKFEQAYDLSEYEESKDYVIEALKILFGDSGHFDGSMGILVGYVVSKLLQEEEKE